MMRSVSVLNCNGKGFTEHVIPEWANFVARDESGKLWAYEQRPEQSPESVYYYLGFWFPNINGGNIRELENPVHGRTRACADWKNTLVEVY